MPHVGQETLTFPEHLVSLPLGVHDVSFCLVPLCQSFDYEFACWTCVRSLGEIDSLVVVSNHLLTRPVFVQGNF